MNEGKTKGKKKDRKDPSEAREERVEEGCVVLKLKGRKMIR